VVIEIHGDVVVRRRAAEADVRRAAGARVDDGARAADLDGLAVAARRAVLLQQAVIVDGTGEVPGAFKLLKVKNGGHIGDLSPVVVEVTTCCYVHEISWDILGPSSDANLAGNYYPTSALLAEFPDEACAIVADHAARAPSADCGVICNQLGGKAAEVPKDATAV
jgi:hypothetical protein